jgi:MFS superfamily sulfate permease-like transporter
MFALTFFGMAYSHHTSLIFVCTEAGSLRSRCQQKENGLITTLETALNFQALGRNLPNYTTNGSTGILHVPINVPALAFSMKEDNLNLDRELIAHGLSNVLSGFAGSIQNYLVYSNSVLFLKAGGGSRLAGIMLALLTMVVLFIGPAVIGFIPVMMVGTLIFLLGFELFLEAVWDTRKKLKALEYITVRPRSLGVSENDARINVS